MILKIFITWFILGAIYSFFLYALFKVGKNFDEEEEKIEWRTEN